MRASALRPRFWAVFLSAAFASIPARPAAVTFRDFHIQGCRGANFYSDFSVGGNQIIHTASPDFFVWLTTSGATNLVNTAGGGPYPNPSATALGGVQNLWNFDTATGVSVDAAASSNLTFAAGAGGSCAGSTGISNAINGLNQTFRPADSTIGNTTICTATTNNTIPFSGMSKFTVEAWVKLNGLACRSGASCNGNVGNGVDWPIVVQCQAQSADKCLILMTRSLGAGACQGGAPEGANTPYFAFYDDDVCGGNIPSDGQWHHLAFVYTGSAKAIYLDGNLVSGGHLGGTTGSYSGTATTFIGQGGGYEGLWASGWIDSVRVWNIQLLQGTIAAHALGQFYSIAGSTTMTRGGAGAANGSLSGNTINNVAAGSGGAGKSLLWAFGVDGTFVGTTASIGAGGTRNIIPTAGGQDTTASFQFTEEDDTESIAPAGVVSVTVRQATMSSPPPPMFQPVDQTTVRIDEPSWFCDPFPYTGQPAPQTPNANVKYNYTITNITAGSPAPNFSFSNIQPSSVTFHSLSPNVRYSITAGDKYTDAGGNNQTIGPSGNSTSASTTTLAWPPAAPTGLTVAGGDKMNMTMTLTAPPADAAACSTLGTGYNLGGTCPNPNYTSTTLLGSTDNGSTYVTQIPYTNYNLSSVVVSAAGLNRSSKYLFKAQNENLDGVQTALSAATAAPALNGPGITQPLTPLSITGDSSLGSVLCPKTDIQWRWSSVPIGSNQAPTASGYCTAYMLSDINNPFKGSIPDCGIANSIAGTCAAGAGTAAQCVTNNTTYYIQGGQGTPGALTPNTQYFAKVNAFDAGAPNTPINSATDIRFSAGSFFASATTAPSDVSPATNLTPTSLVGQVQWTWTAPPNLCAPQEYTVVDMHTGLTLSVFNDASAVLSYFQSPLGPNAQVSIAVRARDDFGTSPLSVPATGYSQAFPPQNGAFVGVSTGGIVFTWNSNGNPGYTRYEVSMSPDNFATGVLISTPINISANFTQTAAAFTGLTPGTSYFFRVRAANGKVTDNLGGLFTSFTSAGGQTLWPAPAVTGGAISKSAITWQWPSTAGVSFYRATLVNTGGQTDYLPGYPVTLSSSPINLATNTRYSLQVSAYNGQGLGNAAAAVPVYTFADVVSGLQVVRVTTNSISYSWSQNTNPAGTFFEVDVATNPAVSPTVAVVTPAAPAVTVGGLFPGTTYFGQVRAFNGDLIPVNPYVQFASTRTDLDAAIAATSAPVTVYSIPQGAVGLWHFDESSGTVASDSSTVGNAGRLTCLYNACVSTPTWTAGPSGLGSAVNLQGLTSSFVQIPDKNPEYHFAGGITLEAWVKPATTAQPNGAGIATKGLFNNEDMFLDIAGGRYRFSGCQGGTVGATNAAVANTGIAVGQWTHLAGVFNSGTGINTLYVNGVAAGNTTVACGHVSSTENLAVGSRRSATGAFDLGFQGAIDEVRLMNVAETPAQVLADYSASLISTVTMVGSAAGLQLALPPNAFGGPATIYATADPINHPLKVSVPELMQGLANPPTGQTLIRGMLFEIVPTVNGAQFTTALGSTATVILSYIDNNSDGIIDGTNPPIAAANVRMYTLDTALGSWVQLLTRVDKAARTISGLTPHFSVFAAFGASTTGANASAARIYPNPWKQGSGGRFDAPVLTFDTLPSQGFIRIYNLSGQKINELHFALGNAGSVTWNGLNINGRSAASGVYFAYVKSDADDSSRVLKFAIER